MQTASTEAVQITHMMGASMRSLNHARGKQQDLHETMVAHAQAVASGDLPSATEYFHKVAQLKEEVADAQHLAVGHMAAGNDLVEAFRELKQLREESPQQMNDVNDVNVGAPSTPLARAEQEYHRARLVNSTCVRLMGCVIGWALLRARCLSWPTRRMLVMGVLLVMVAPSG